MPNLLLRKISFVVLFSSIVFFSCGDSSKDQPEDKSSEEVSSREDLQTGLKEMSEMMDTEMTEGKEPVPPVSFKVLMNFLPKEVPGLIAGKPKGETVQWQKWTHSSASIDFDSETGDQSARVNIYDYAYISNLYLPYQMMFKMKFERESSEGYEKSTELNGMPTFEKWNEEGKDNEVTILVGKRFIVNVDTNNMPEGSARKIAEGLNLKALANETTN